VIAAIAQRSGVSQKGLGLIAKARRVTVEMVETLGFIHTQIALHLAGLSIFSSQRAAVATQQVPGLYLQRVAAQATRAEDRHAISATAERLLLPLRHREHPLAQLDAQTAEQVASVAKTCADRFQRSSPCVEGRNGQLALFHYGLHRLTEAKLAALTAVHNFHTRRPDGTTPADRFFEMKHGDLFDAIIQRMPQLPRPARPRSMRPYREPMRRVA
jgi:hypothetical protein